MTSNLELETYPPSYPNYSQLPAALAAQSKYTVCNAVMLHDNSDSSSGMCKHINNIWKV